MGQLPPLTGAGQLPVGRFRCDIAEIEQRFVADPSLAASTTRSQIWTEWNTATAAIRSYVEVCAVWLSGSFLSGKVDPGDLDCVYIIEDALFDAAASADPTGAAFLDRVVRNTLGLQLDTFVLAWRPNPLAGPRDARDYDYLWRRGYWDDFWQRLRSGAKGAAPVRADALPRRGYAEVILDDFRP